jgi:hypothetical protein
MKASFILYLLVYFYFIDALNASNRNEAIDTYLRPIIAQEVENRNSGMWQLTEQGGYLMRHLLDVTERIGLFLMLAHLVILHLTIEPFGFLAVYLSFKLEMSLNFAASGRQILFQMRG